MSLYTRRYAEKGQAVWWINVQWKGYARIHVSAGTHQKRQAQALLSTVKQLKAAGRRDLLGLIASRRLDLHDVHAALLRDPQAIMQLRAEEPSPSLGPLVDEWLTWLRSAAAISPRTQRRYRPQTIRRYEVSWNRLFAVLSSGRKTTLAELNSGALAQYRKERTTDRCHGQTVNRDFAAVQSLLRWVREEKELVFESPRVRKVKESAGRERWLSAAEIEVVSRVAPPEWWTLFALLIYTGMRIGEALGLRWADIRFADGLIAIHSGYRELKSDTSDRDVPIPEPLARLLAAMRYGVPANRQRWSSVTKSGVIGASDASGRESWRKLGLLTAVCMISGTHLGSTHPGPESRWRDSSGYWVTPTRI